MEVSERATVVADGIHRLSIPTPFIVGRVNAYLIAGAVPTLIDTGPNTGTSLDELELALSDCDLRVEDIGRLVLTHQHPDHVGLAGIIARRSGAEVVSIDRLAPFLADWAAASSRDDDVAGDLLRENGFDEHILGVMSATGRAFRAFGSSVTVDRSLAHGETIDLGERSFEVLLRPGHSPSDTIFMSHRDGLLIGGDHLLQHVSSNPVVTAPLAPDAPAERRPRALPDYLKSLSLTREMDVEMVLPGHGEPFSDHRTLIDERFTMHQRRADKLLSAMQDGPKTAFELAFGLWGRVAHAQTFLTLSEVVGHMDLLEDEGRIEVVRDGSTGIVRYKPI